MVYEAVGNLMIGIGLMGGTIGVALLMMMFGIGRGMTKNKDVYALIFSSFSWAVALIAPQTFFAWIMFLGGAIGLTYVYLPQLNKMEDTNIWAIAVIALIMNVTLLLASNAYVESIDWTTNLNSVRSDMINVFSDQDSNLDNIAPVHGLCSPNDQDCQNSAITGAFDGLLFDVFASVLNIADYIGKAIKFAGMAVLAPLIMGQIIAPMVTNSIIAFFIGIQILLFNIAILYKTVAFILNKRGMSG